MRVLLRSVGTGISKARRWIKILIEAPVDADLVVLATVNIGFPLNDTRATVVLVIARHESWLLLF